MGSESNCHTWTLDELDLEKPLVQLSSLIHDKQQLMETLFTIVSTREIKQMIPDNLKVSPDSMDGRQPIFTLFVPITAYAARHFEGHMHHRIERQPDR